jgi:alkylation response protein AidB-like acyl-CoA dehydrogenase
MGPYAAPYLQDFSDDQPHLGDEAAARAASSYFNNRKLSIFGGSNEIQKNIISKMILGL